MFYFYFQSYEKLSLNLFYIHFKLRSNGVSEDEVFRDLEWNSETFLYLCLDRKITLKKSLLIEKWILLLKILVKSRRIRLL